MTTAIQWADEVWNPIRGCSRVSAGCMHCYAERQAMRFGAPGQPYEGLVKKTSRGPAWTGEIRLVEEALEQPLRWRKPRRIFVASMSDPFHPGVPEEFLDRMFAVMSLCPQHVFQLLTKRAAAMAKYFADPDVWARMEMSARRMYRKRHNRQIAGKCLSGPLRNVWLGVSVEDQRSADERIPLLMRTPAAVRWLSCEPLLSAIDLRNLEIPRRYGTALLDCLTCDLKTHQQEVFAGPPAGTGPIDWVVTGGESGPGARGCDVAWIRAIVAQCLVARIPVFVKQLGAHPFGGGVAQSDSKGGNPQEWPSDLRVREFPAY